MLALTKKPLISKKNNVFYIVYGEVAYHIPKTIMEKYKIPTKKTAHQSKQVSDGAILADELFSALDRKYTRPGVMLRGLRVRENLSQIDFAKKIGVSQSDLSKMELGKRSIGKVVAKRIAKVFDAPYQSFLG